MTPLIWALIYLADLKCHILPSRAEWGNVLGEWLELTRARVRRKGILGVEAGTFLPKFDSASKPPVQ